MIDEERALLESKWSHSQGVDLATHVEAVCPRFGCHVALTGGLLYKTGPRKDCDLVFYRIRQVPEIDVDGLFEALETIGLVKIQDFGFVVKAEYDGKGVDCMFPEARIGSYPGER